MGNLRLLLAVLFVVASGGALSQSTVIVDSNTSLVNPIVPSGTRQFLDRQVRLPFTREMRTLRVEKFGSYYFYQGDIIVGEDGMRVATVGEENDNLWPNGSIPLVIGEQVLASPDALEAVYDALNALMTQTELVFVPRHRQNDYVEIIMGPGTPGAAASSALGRQGGRQVIIIHEPSVGAGTMVHELLHTAGLYHEQSRADRDHFVDLDLRGMSDDQRANFDKVEARVLGNYDYASIMHYGPFAFSPGGNQTIYCKSNGVRRDCHADMGQRTGLSDGDIAGLDAIYSLISRFSSGGWDASFTRPVPQTQRGPFTGALRWSRQDGSPQQSSTQGGVVDYARLDFIAPRQMVLTWKGGVKKVSYTDWRDSISVRYLAPEARGDDRWLPYLAYVPKGLPLILKSSLIRSAWSPPPRSVVCSDRSSFCEYHLWIENGSTVPIKADSPRTYDVLVEGRWGPPGRLTPAELANEPLSLNAIERVLDEPLWSMQRVRGVFATQP